MSKRIGGWCLLVATLSGCAPAQPGPREGDSAPLTPAAAPADKGGPSAATPTSPGTQKPLLYADDRILARVGTNTQRTVTMAQVIKPLIESHGLNTLLLVVQLELAKLAAEDAKVVVTAEDIKNEREATLGKMFRENDEKVAEDIEAALKAKKPELAERFRKQGAEDRERFLKQFMDQQRISPAEMEIVLETNAYLRKVAEPYVKKQITDELLQKEFAIRYNEQAKIRHIQLNTMGDAVKAMARLKAGEAFEKVAYEMSTNQRTRVLKGEFPPFSRENPDLPQNFKDAAFALKPGDVSELVSTGDTYHLIKLEEKILPKSVKFADVKETLQHDLMDRTITAVMGEIRDNIGKVARDSLQIDNPTLATQFKEKLEAFTKKADTERLLLEQERDKLRAAAATQPGTTRPVLGPVPPSPSKSATVPALVPPATTAPITAPIAPATMPASAPSAAPASATRPAGASTRPAGVPN